MKVLFVSSGNTINGISPIIRNQGESLVKQGVELDFFTVKGKGLKGYLKTIPRLKKELSYKGYDIVHAHYSLSAFVASFAGARPLVVSLMGSDINSNKYFRIIIKLFAKFFWTKTVLKSHDMKDTIRIKDAEIIPNGVDFDRFKLMSKKEAQNFICWDNNVSHILFAANPNRKVKNFNLAKQAYENIYRDNNVKLHYLNNIPNDEMPYYYNASDTVLLTSKWEGSPNVIKEAMACNVPVVSTDVGDVREVIGQTQGCFVTSDNPDDIAEKVRRALVYGKRTSGRENIMHLDSSVIARKLMNVYKKVKKDIRK